MSGSCSLATLAQCRIDEPPGQVYRLPAVGAFTYVVVGTAILLIGQVTPTGRLDLLGFHFDTLFQVTAAVGVLILGWRGLDLRPLVMIAPLLPMLATVLWSADPEYGLHKGANLAATEGQAKSELHLRLNRQLGIAPLAGSTSGTIADTAAKGAAIPVTIHFVFLVSRSMMSDRLYIYRRRASPKSSKYGDRALTPASKWAETVPLSLLGVKLEGNSRRRAA